MPSELTVPVVFLIFRRPELTRRVFQRIAMAKPQRLFIIADGPRNETETALVYATREVVETITWDCDVQRNYAHTNMGLRLRISSGLDWVFEQVEQAIILEDDCLPHPSFFRFCQELLDKYMGNDDVMHISGDNFGYKRPQGNTDSYYFSRFAHVWGWATWRRAWARYDVGMKNWNDMYNREQVLSQFPHQQRLHWQAVFDKVFCGEIQTWDYQWFYTCLLYKGKCVMPYENQIENLGMGIDATNTKNKQSQMSNIPTSNIVFPLRHPKSIECDSGADTYTLRNVFGQKSLLMRGIDRITRTVVTLSRILRCP